MILSCEMWSVWFPVHFHVPLGIVGLIITIIIVETNDSHVDYQNADCPRYPLLAPSLSFNHQCSFYRFVRQGF